MITCSVCGCLNNPSNAICEECGSDLIDETELYTLYDDDDSISESGFDNDDFLGGNDDYNGDYDDSDYDDDY